MRRTPQLAATAGLAALSALPLARPQNGSQPSDLVFRVTANLVQVDAVVTDSKGKHVADLKREEFQILEDGRPQSITHFAYVHVADPVAHAPAPTAPHLPASSRPLERDGVQRTIVLMADDVGLSPDGMLAVRAAMKDFVERQMRAGDLVSVMATSGGMGVAQSLTSDKRQLKAAIDRIHWSPGRSGLSWYAPVRRGSKALEFEHEGDARMAPIRQAILGAATPAALVFAIEGLRDMPGRKAIALFSEGFGGAGDGIVELANRASVVLYAFDPRGVASFGMRADDLCETCPARTLTSMESGRQAGFDESQQSLDQMARGTGGLFFHANNDLDRGLSEVADDMDGYYLIGYGPHREDSGGKRGESHYRRIEVRVLRAGMQVRSRKGFADSAGASEGAVQANGKPGREALQRAMLSPFQANGFPVRLNAFYSASAGKGAKTGLRATSLRAMLAMDAHGLVFKEAPDGGKELTMDVMAAVYGPDGRLAAGSDKTFHAAMTAEEMSQTVSSGLVYGLDVAIPAPGPYQLRVAARDANSERVGSATAFVEVPDFNRGGMVLSSLVIMDSDSKRNETLASAGVLGAGNPVTRVFAPGAVLDYDCTIVGLPLDKQRPRTLNVEVSVFRGAEAIFSSPQYPVAVPSGGSAAPVHATGKIRLAPTLPPGDYAVQLSVSGGLESSTPRRAAQWTDFTLAQ